MRMNATRDLKAGLDAGERLLSVLIGPGNEPDETMRVLHDLGISFAIVETEHSLVGKDTIFQYVRASRKYGVPVLMRPEEYSANFRSFLDAGVNGLMLPKIDTVKAAAEAVDKTYFPPLGHRGCGLSGGKYLVDSQDMDTTPLLELLCYANNNTMLFPMTESLAAIGNLPQILRMDGITGTIVGVLDLALDIGNIDVKASRHEATTTTTMQARLHQILETCKQAKKPAGIGGLPLKHIAEFARKGYQILLVGYVMDGDFASLQKRVDELRCLIT